MKSVILTKVNKVALSFSKQIEANNGKGKGDFEFLKEFVRLAHPKSELTINEADKTINAYSSKASYRYTISYTHIIRVSLDNSLNGKNDKVYYKIS